MGYDDVRDDVEYLRESALGRFRPFLARASSMVYIDTKQGRDDGTCVLGAGIAADLIPPRARNPKRRILIPAPFQGNVGSYRACLRALMYLRTVAPSLGAYWYDGIMD